MEIPPGRLAGAKPVRSWLLCLVAVFWLPYAIPATAADPPLMAEFPALESGSPCQSAMVWLADPPMLVTVVPPGANPMRPKTSGMDHGISLRVIGHDPVSRLGFLQASGAGQATARPWLTQVPAGDGIKLRAITADGPLDCQVAGWVKQIGGKVLPLALLNVSFQGPVPAPGTPLLDSRNRVAAIVFQKTGAERTGYAIPAEAVHRVRRDISDGGMLVRGWVGFALNAQNPSPRIVRVLPDSPAATAGIRASDLLLQVGSRAIRQYPDVPDALFYLIPGEPVPIAVQRDGRRIEMSVTPVRPR